MSFQIPPAWKQAPFIRLVIPLMAGIAASWYLLIPAWFAWSICISSTLMLFLFGFNKIFIQFSYNWIRGVLLHIAIFTTGILLICYNDYSRDQVSLNHLYKSGDIIIARLEEPLTQKSKTFKAEASVQAIFRNNRFITVKTNILLYIQKNQELPLLVYGTKIIFYKTLQPIKNSGNPNTFDYQRYCIFQHIFYQVYLSSNEFSVLQDKDENFFKKYLFTTRSKILTILRSFLKTGKEIGLAEALLIGYKDDLDKELIQSYTQTGVVHIIAISGLHLALIYGLLELLLKKFRKGKKHQWINPIILLSALWIFSFLSGASPSVLRSAVMFSFIIIGKQFSKSNSVYNSLAASAFLLLCYNPFWLWDTGFQLSYAAVLSIVMFMRPIYNCFFVQNKILDLVWKSTSVTLAAQILTFPISVYYFHQFPIYFLFTNLLAVPLSSLVLIGELLVCIISLLPAFASIAGVTVSWLIYILNSFIEHMQSLPFSIWDHLYITLFQLIAIYLVIACISFWLTAKNKFFLFASLIALLSFITIRTFHFSKSYKQQLLVVYNVPKHQAIDFVKGREYIFICDSSLVESEVLQNFYLQPARTALRISPDMQLDCPKKNNHFFRLGSKRIIVIDQSTTFIPSASKVNIDIVIISKNPSIRIYNLAQSFTCRQWIFDSSNPGWKINKWKKECEQLGFPCHDVVDKGAFVMNMD